MGCFDKTYVNGAQLKEAYNWAKEIGTVSLENGRKFSPMDFLRAYNEDIDSPDFDWNKDEYVLWNTPVWYDRWLWVNCPFDFVKEYLQMFYSPERLKSFENYVYHNPKNDLEFGRQHYTFLKVPKFRWYKWYMNNSRRKNPWPGNCKQATYFIEIKAPHDKGFDWRDDLEYDSITDNWYSEREPLPVTRNYIWQNYHKRIPNKKSIIRELRRWYIPKGYIVRVYNLKYVDMDYEILVK